LPSLLFTPLAVIRSTTQNSANFPFTHLLFKPKPPTFPPFSFLHSPHSSRLLLPPRPRSISSSPLHFEAIGHWLGKTLCCEYPLGCHFKPASIAPRQQLLALLK
jgi:hypothetical protein